MPSRFEPCGLSQLYAIRYGTLPIVRATGGLVDTVTSYEEATGAGTGFVFYDLRPDSLADTIGWAISTWYNRPAHIDAMRRRAMAEDHSWDQAAREYAQIYLAAYARRRGHGFSAADSPERERSTEPDPRQAPSPFAIEIPRNTGNVTRSDRLPPLPARYGRTTAVRERLSRYAER
jgi:hypothetical protein